MNNKNILGLVLVALVVFGSWYFLSQNSVSGEVVAIVNGEKILNSEYQSLRSQISNQQGLDLANIDEKTSSELQKYVVDSLVSKVLLKQAVEKSDISVSDEDVKGRVETIKGQFEDNAGYEKALSDNGITEKDLLSQIKEEIAVQSYLEKELTLSSIKISDSEAKDAYDKVAGTQEVPPFEEVKSQIENSLMQEKQMVLINGLIDKLKTSAEIEVLI